MDSILGDYDDIVSLSLEAFKGEFLKIEWNSRRLIGGSTLFLDGHFWYTILEHNKGTLFQEKEGLCATMQHLDQLTEEPPRCFTLALKGTRPEE